MAIDTPTSDTMPKEGNPFAKFNHNVRQTQAEINEQSLRRSLLKVANDFDVPWDKCIEQLAAQGPVEEAAQDMVKGNQYLDAFTLFCRNECLKTIPPQPAPKTAGDGKPRIVGHGRDRHIDTGVIKMPQAKGGKQTQAAFDDKSAEPKPATTVLGTPIDPAKPIEPPPMPESTKIALESLRNGNKQNFDAQPDELTGKPDDIIQGEVIEGAPDKPEKPQSEFDTFDKPSEPAPEYIPLGRRVAEMLNAAFPDASEEYKLNFYREATGFPTIAKGEAEAGSATILTSLEEAIEESKTLVVLPDSPKTVEIVGISNKAVTDATTPEIENRQIAPNIQPSNVEVKEPTTKALAIAPKSEVATVQSMIGFRIPTQEQFAYMQQLAKFVAQSGFYKDVATEAKAMVIFMKGFAINVEPMTALDGIFVIGGRPYVGAKLVKGLLEASGRCQRFDVVGDATKCTVTIQRKGRPQPNVYTFTMDDARAAKLMSSGMYEKYPAQMLRWRTIKIAVDTDFPELGFGLGRDPDEDDEAEAA